MQSSPDTGRSPWAGKRRALPAAPLELSRCAGAALAFNSTPKGRLKHFATLPPGCTLGLVHSHRPISSQRGWKHACWAAGDAAAGTGAPHDRSPETQGRGARPSGRHQERTPRRSYFPAEYQFMERTSSGLSWQNLAAVAAVAILLWVLRDIIVAEVKNTVRAVAWVLVVTCKAVFWLLSHVPSWLRRTSEVAPWMNWLSGVASFLERIPSAASRLTALPRLWAAFERVMSYVLTLAIYSVNQAREIFLFFVHP